MSATLRDQELREQFGPRPTAPTRIGLIGYAQSGKDTLGKILTDDYGYTRISFADGVREVALAINPFLSDGSTLADAVSEFGWDIVKSWPQVRQLLQRVGTEAVRDILGQDLWIDLALRKAGKVRRAVFTDVRYQNEAEAILRDGGVLWRITRPGVGPVNRHPSETALDLFPVERTIANNGTVEDLRRAVFCRFR